MSHSYMSMCLGYIPKFYVAGRCMSHKLHVDVFGVHSKI
jgi:hypothetical protein